MLSSINQRYGVDLAQVQRELDKHDLLANGKARIVKEGEDLVVIQLRTADAVAKVLFPKLFHIGQPLHSMGFGFAQNDVAAATSN